MLGRIDIGMVAVAACLTGEQGLLHPAFGTHMATDGAPLRGIARIDGNHLATTPGLFVRQQTAERTPASAVLQHHCTKDTGPRPDTAPH